MDILTHTISGVAAATVVGNFISGSWKKKSSFVLIGGIAGAFPDIDVISMWSGFDGTFGKWFGLQHSGKEIFSAHFWYSHHGFFHSVLAAVVFGLIMCAFIFFFRLRKSKSIELIKLLPLFITFFMGYCFHLLEDMITPSGGWGGVNFWWPSTEYIGGYAKIWWWNNYDVFLIVLSIAAFNGVMMYVVNKSKLQIKLLSLVILSIGIFLSMEQINNRNFNFTYNNKKLTYQECEQKSLEIQKEVLGTSIFNIMRKLDGVIPVAF